MVMFPTAQIQKHEKHQLCQLWIQEFYFILFIYLIIAGNFSPGFLIYQRT